MLLHPFEDGYVWEVLGSNNLQLVQFNSLVLLLSHYHIDKNCQKWLNMGNK